MAISNPLEGKLVVLIGGGGFVGTRVAQELLRRGARLRVASRHPERAHILKPLGNLGQVHLVACDVTRPETVRAVMQGADAAVYLVGAFSGDVEGVQRDGAGVAAAAAREAGADGFVYFSAIGADADSDVRYARTKAEGERAVLTAFPQATILRPSVLFAEDDDFIGMFARLIAAMPVLPVFGPDAKLQPLFVDDAAEAAVNALACPARHGGKTYEIGGPEVIAMATLNRRIAAAQGRGRIFIDLPDGVSAAIATLTGWLPGAPITRDQWKLLKAGSVASGEYPGIKALGVSPRPLDLFLDRWMPRYRKHGRFGIRTSTVRR